jgi:hypothetical protein
LGLSAERLDDRVAEASLAGRTWFGEERRTEVGWWKQHVD